MNHAESLSDLHNRLDALEKRLAEKEAEIGQAGDISSHDREQIDETYAKARAIRKKFVRAEASSWDQMKLELEADWEALSHSFEYWVRRVDEKYRSRGS